MTKTFLRFTASLLIPFVILAGCSGDTFRSAVDGISDKTREQVGIFDDPGGHHVIIVHPGLAETDAFLEEVQPAVERAAEAGAQLDVLIVNDANAAAAVAVPLPAAGDLAMEAQNEPARVAERSENITAVMTAIALNLPPTATEAGPADVFGALVRGVSMASDQSPSTVTVITGGGLHRTVAIDLLAAFDDGTPPDELVQLLPKAAGPEVVVEIRGAGLFPGLSPAPALELTGLIHETWKLWCLDHRDRLAGCSINGIELGTLS